MQALPEKVAQPWLHWWALVTLAAALPLLFLGAEVTTLGVGMVDAQGLRSPWYFFQEFLADRGLDWKIEHGHRQAGWIIGNCAIVLVVLTWWREPRRWVRWLSVLALAAVCVQGLLGIFRIELNARLGTTLALIHGGFASVIFALLAVLVAVTARHWTRGAASAEPCSPRLRRWAIFSVVVVYAQLILGGLVRHKDFTLMARAHLLGAFAVLATVIWLAKLALESGQRAWLARSVVVLLFLVCVQLLLGVESWLSKFFVPQAPWNQLQPLAVYQDFVRSIHYVVGTMIFATTVVVAINVHWQGSGALSLGPAARPMEGAA